MIKVKIIGAGISIKYRDLSKNLQNGLQSALNEWADNVATDAKSLVSNNSSDEGNLVNSIRPKYAKLSGGMGKVSVVANTSYAAYIEFGTRKFASSYVPTLPQNWQDIASKAKGKSNSGDFYDFVLAIAMWVKRKGITARYSVKTRKKLKSTKADEERELNAAWKIAWSIFKNGIRPRPFLYPSVNKNYPKLMQDIKDVLKLK